MGAGGGTARAGKAGTVVGSKAVTKCYKRNLELTLVDTSVSTAEHFSQRPKSCWLGFGVFFEQIPWQLSFFSPFF